jgi:FRG domain
VHIKDGKPDGEGMPFEMTRKK